MTESKVIELRRDLGLWGAVSIVVGTVIGSGIFLVPRTMVLRVGSPTMVFVVWVFRGAIVTLRRSELRRIGSRHARSGRRVCIS